MSNPFASFRSSSPSTHNAPRADVYNTPEDFLEIEVTNPVTHSSAASKYTDYQVLCRTNIPAFRASNSSVRRRFSDFALLRQLLAQECPRVQLPPLPDASLLSYSHRFSPDFIESRRAGLERFLNIVATHPLVQTGSHTLVAFVQDQKWPATTASASATRVPGAL